MEKSREREPAAAFIVALFLSLLYCLLSLALSVLLLWKLPAWLHAIEPRKKVGSVRKWASASAWAPPDSMCSFSLTKSSLPTSANVNAAAHIKAVPFPAKQRHLGYEIANILINKLRI